ncbi:MAG: N-6 DNA methylase [Acidobacteria bacterium]|nr:N-6 DNA methylase [Acidobacteriota bacterium]
MASRRRPGGFQTIRSEGGLLPTDLLRRLTDPHSTLPGTRLEDYALAAGERVNEAVTQSWNRLRKHWREFRAVAADLPEGVAGTRLTNEKWSLPLLRELGFGLLPATTGPEIDGRSYPIRRSFGPVPIHLIGCGLSLDSRAAGQHGAASGNPHGLVQDLLNRDDARLWAIVSNGLRLRILRDNQALSRQSWLEFDLEAMFSGEVYADFVLLWLVVHATRFAPREGERPETCWLEQWTREAERQGARALGELRGSVERVLQVLGAGFTAHPKNVRLREALRSGTLALDDFHGQLLRVVYRLIFLFVAEDRILDGQPLLHPRDDSDPARIARERFVAHYSTGRLRELAGRIKGSRHGDLWRQFQLLARALSGDPGFETARRALALPALGSFLWDSDATAALNGAELTNYDFLESLRRLAFIRQDKVLRPVDYRNLGAEELGGVYESLLGLTPRLNGDGARFTFEEFAGNVRKTSGSYYTPDELVQCLLDSALDPVVEAAIRDKVGSAAERAILELKVCDPAVGSGHFLVGAAHRLARHLARVRAHAVGDAEPPPRLYQHALRDVIGRCLYGVDVNPMAAELCRVSLWLEALEPGKPLSFLDHHIRVGDSLLGATPDLVEAGLPDEAFKRIEGDDQTVCSELRKRNRVERDSGQQDMGRLMVAETRPEYGSLASLSRGVDESPDGTLGDVRRKATRFRSLVVSPQYRHEQLVADVWCAAFVWPKRAGDSPSCITTDTVKALRSEPDAMAPAQSRRVAELANRYRFLHWHLAFPEVFENGGFDCVLGNPPWERVKIEEKAWFAQRRPEIAQASTAAKRKQMIGSLETDDPVLYGQFLNALRNSAARRHLIGNSGRYPLCGRGDIDLYTVFAEMMRGLVNDRGRVGCVVPTGIATDDTTKFFFQEVVATESLISLLDFENHGKRFFPDVRADKKFCLFTTGSGVQHASATADFVFFARAVEDVEINDRRFTLSAGDIGLLNPNTRNCPIFRTRMDAVLGKAIYRRVHVLVRESENGPDPIGNPWNLRFSTMFHMANDSGLFRSRTELEAEGWRLSGNVFCRNGEEHLPLYEGKMVHQFDHRWQTWEDGDRRDVTVLEKRSPDSTVLPRHWVQAREVYLRIADLPRGLLDALRKRDRAAILFCVAHLLFAHWLHGRFGELANQASREIFPAWMAFVAHHPFARAVAMAGMVSSLADASACIQPLDRSYVPALPLDELSADELDIDELSRTPWWTRKEIRDSGAVWYAAEHDRVSVLLKFASDNRHLFLPAGSLREADAAVAYAEELLVRTSPRWLIGCRDVTASTDSRTVICSAFPASAVGHKLPVWRVSGEHVHVFPSILCSFACDFAARLKLGGKSLAFFVAKQLPVLSPTTLSLPAPWLATQSPKGTIRDWLVPRILELTYTTDHLETFARECDWNGPPFRWDEERRFLLRCELDAAFFHLYLPSDDRGDWRPARSADGCPHDETSAELDELRAHFSSPRAAVGYVMDTFPIVRRKDEERFGQYRTRDVILEIYDALQEAVATGTSYRSKLDPAPADPRCCHLPRAVAVATTVPEPAVLPDGAWASPVTGDQVAQEVPALAAVLKAIGAPAPIRRVRLAALLAMEPRLLTPSLSPANAEEWCRLIGSEAEPLPTGVSQLRRPGYAWGAAVRQLRVPGDLLEDLEEKTWAPGPAIDAIETGGWPDGRVRMVLDVLHRRGEDEIVRTLPQAARVWIDAAA